MKNSSTVSASQRLAETGILIAVSLVAGLIPLLELPYGGSITACSCLPIFMIAYRFGTPWGMFAGFVFGLLQLLLGMKNVMFFTSPLSIVTVMLLDYLAAYAVIAVGALWRRFVKEQQMAFLAGILTGFALRYFCHAISGCTVWAGLSIPSKDALIYSLAYNATYMVPEAIITAIGGFFLSNTLDFSGIRLRHLASEHFAGKNRLFVVLQWLSILVAVVCDVLLVFACLQNPESGNFDISGLSRVNWPAFGLCSVCGLGLWFLFGRLAKRKKLPESEQSADR